MAYLGILISSTIFGLGKCKFVTADCTNIHIWQVMHVTLVYLYSIINSYIHTHTHTYKETHREIKKGKKEKNYITQLLK